MTATLDPDALEKADRRTTPRSTSQSPSPGRRAHPSSLGAEGFGPLGRACGVASLALSVVVGLQSVQAPLMASFLILVLAFGAVLNAPAAAIRRMPVSLTALAFIAWMGLSLRWSNDPVVSEFFVQRDLPIVVAVVICAGVLPLRDVTRAFNLGIRLVVAITLVAVALIPTARFHADPTGLSIEIPGWHGLFEHKNTMTPVLLIGLSSILAFDRTRWPRYLTLAGIGALIVGSDSGTGVASTVLVLSLWAWFLLYRRMEHRFGTAFVLATVSVLVSLVVGIVLSLQSVVEAYGKDITFTGRTFIWAAVRLAIEDRPWFGYGMGGLLWGSDAPTSETTRTWREISFQVPHAHNGVLDVTVQYGIIGMALYAAFFATLLVGGWRLVRGDHLVGVFALVSALTLAFVSISEPVFAGRWMILTLVAQHLVLRAHAASKRSEVIDLEVAGSARTQKKLGRSTRFPSTQS